MKTKNATTARVGALTNKDAKLLELYIAMTIVSRCYTKSEIAVLTDLYYNLTGQRYDFSVASEREKGLIK